MNRLQRAGCAIAAFAAASEARADTRTVYVFDYDFSINLPAEPVQDATIQVGDTVRWLFLDSGHSTTSCAGIAEVWNSGYIGVVGQTYEHTFTHAGTFWYYCFPHGMDLGNGTAKGMSGTITVVRGCYANCDGSATGPALNVNDFLCFQSRFAMGDAWANCDQSTVPPLLDINDFLCFLNRFGAGCP